MGVPLRSETNSNPTCIGSRIHKIKYMTFYKNLFKFFIVASLLVVGGSVTSCQDDDIVEEIPSLPEEGVCKPGDDFYTYANADWLQSLEGKDPEGKYSWFRSIEEMNDEKLKAIKDDMPQYQALRSSLAKLETNYEESVALVNGLVAELAEIETREQAYVAFGKLIGLGITSLGTFHTAIYHEDNTIGYSIYFPVEEEEETTDVASVHPIIGQTHRLPLQGIKRTPGSRSVDDAIEGVIEGLGLDPEHYLHITDFDPFFEALQQAPLEDLVEQMIGAVTTELLMYCSDQHANEFSEGKYGTVKEYIDDTIEKDLGYFTSYMYCKRYVTKEMQDTFSEFGDKLLATFRKRLQNNTWLTAATIAEAIDKVDHMEMFYGDARIWPMTEGPQLEGELLVEDVLNIKQSRYEIIQSVLGEIYKDHVPLLGMYYHPDESFFTYRVNAFHMFIANACFILPPLMMEPAYSPDHEEVEIYATLGSILAHEITHGFDKLGSTYNKHGKKENWWAAEDLAKFESLNERRIALNSVFEVLPGHPTDAEKTIVEDVADLGGVAVAYDLWVTTLQQRGIKGEELRQQKRAFFMHYAKVFREKYSDEYLIERMSKDTHSVGPIRINGVVQHMDEWYDLFNVQEGDALYLAPEERIHIW